MFLQLAHTKTNVFEHSKSLTLECYKLTKKFPSEEKFAMIQQIRRAALSVHFNIAEGASRKSLNERKQFFEITCGSVVEIDTAFDISNELQYIEADVLKTVGSLIVETFKQLSKSTK